MTDTPPPLTADKTDAQDTNMTEPKPITCRGFCFQGYTGMDTCRRCAGTGSQLYFNGRYAPNTKKGWDDLLKGQEHDR